ncbi:MAG: AAA family ATPase [Lentisphaeria bacterium]|nr:AAA family ATPase [Lentisphaeria bacterium]
MSVLLDQIRGAVVGRSPVVYLLSSEEERVMEALAGIAAENGDPPIRVWTCVNGLEGAPDPEATRDPVAAMAEAVGCQTPTFFVFKDLPPFLERPEVVRSLRHIYYSGREVEGRYVFLLAAELAIPESLRKEVQLIEVPPPDESEIAAQIERVCRENPGYVISTEALGEVILALKGMTETEIRHVVHRVAQHSHASKDELLEEIFTEKRNIVKKSGFLEFSPPRWDISGLGGLDNLKDWLNKRRHLFSREALAAGVPVPKGLLMMGVSGCGKSLAVKVISSLWQVPLFRLDMNLVFSGMYGTPEEAFHKALKTIESVAPAILWLDEIENALGIEEEGLKIDSHIFSAFLTWMQEKPPLIFIAATANRIQALPAEIIRKGRFDQVFFCDLPTEPERNDIFRIHLLKNSANPDDFDFKMLAVMTEGWNGAEIEQAVISARTEAYYEGRMFSQRDLSAAISKIVPLSETMEQQIKGIRSWAFSRATPASKYARRRG